MYRQIRCHNPFDMNVQNSRYIPRVFKSDSYTHTICALVQQELGYLCALRQEYCKHIRICRFKSISLSIGQSNNQIGKCNYPSFVSARL